MSRRFTRSSFQSANKLRSLSGDIFPGVYRGRIENIDDPDRLGRAKVRVWAIHGDDSRVPDSALPWAEISEIGGGGYDYGSYNPPPVGSSVWVSFEGGHRDYPVVFGTFRGVPERDEDNPNIFLTKNGKPDVESAWAPPDGQLETPKDVFEEVHVGDPHPTKRVWQKSYKGHTFLIEEGDGIEYLKIIDRAGQLIMMDCPVTEEANKGNSAQRGVRDSLRGDSLPYDAIVNRRAAIRIKDLAGQELVLEAKDGDERIIIRSQSKDGSCVNKITLKSGKKNSGITLEDNSGDKFVIDPESKVPILIEDSIGNSIQFNRETGRISINSVKGTDETVKQKTSTVKGTESTTVEGDLIKSILGNVKASVGNDVSIGIVGNTNITFGGCVKVVLGNGTSAGTETYALDIKIATVGSFEIITKVGDWEFGTLLGKGVLRATNLYLGSDLSSQPFVCGNLWSSMMQNILNALIMHTHSSSTGPTGTPMLGLAELTSQLTILMSGSNNPSNPLAKNIFGEKLHIV